ncbi:hypothetical protein K449DRAFT_420692 [Hypoxylon sp. EC38]|nr:hypothetical protein K449DRAFT_420692 [Hypoxylon sp. EC38]
MSSSSKGWECAVPGCGKKFARKEHLNRHALIHDPEHQHKCHICGRRYARSDVFKRHLKQHNSTTSQSSDTRRICLACGERNTQCDGNSPCGACVSNWTECRWIGADNSHVTGVEEATAMPSGGQSPALWFPPNSEAWVSQSFPVTPPYSSAPGDLNPGSLHTRGAAEAVEAASYTPPATGSSARRLEPPQYGSSNSSQTAPQPTSPLSLQQQTASGSARSAGLTDLYSNLDRTSPEIKRLVKLFFADIHPYWAILHEPTFEVEKAPRTLLATMVMLASWLDGGPDHQKLGPVIYEEINRARMDLHPPLHVLQAALLYVVYTTCTLTAGEIVAKTLTLVGWLITTCRYLGIFNGQYTGHQMLDLEDCACPFLAWRIQEQLNRLAFSVLRIDTYLSVLLDHPPSVRYQELCIPLPKSRQLWAAPNEEERRKLQWNEPSGREKALFSFFMRDALNPARRGNLPYSLTDIDYHLSTCATQTHIWEAAREAHSSMSDEIAQPIDPRTFVDPAHPHLMLWRDKRKEDCKLREMYFSGSLTGTEHLLGPHSFTLMYISTLKLHAPLNAMRIKGHYYKSRPGSTIPTRKPLAHIHQWISTGCPRVALWNAAQICRIFTIESTRSNPDSDSERNAGPSSRARLRLNPLLIPGVLMSAIVTCSYARRERSCMNCRAADSNTNPNTHSSTNTITPHPNPNPSCSLSTATAEEAVDLFGLGDHDPKLNQWTQHGVGVPYWGGRNVWISVCQCRLQDIAAWFHDAFSEDQGAEMEFVVFLAELSREAQ